MSIDGYRPWIRPVLSSVLPVSAAQSMNSEPSRPIRHRETSVPSTATEVRADSPWQMYRAISMMALDPTTAISSGFEPCRIPGRMNSVSTRKLTASATRAITPRSRPTTTTASAKIPASSAIGNFRFTSVTEYCRSLGAEGSYAATTCSPSCNCRDWSGCTISVKVRPLSLPVSTRTVAFLQVPSPSFEEVPSAVAVSAVEPPPEALTDLQLTETTLVTVAACVWRSKPTPVRSCGGAPPGHSTTRPTTTAAVKGMRIAAMTLRRCLETGAAGPWLWLCPCEWP